MAGAGQLHLFRGKRQRGVEAPAGSEFALHCSVADVLRRWASPNWVWTHLPMGEYRPPSTAIRLKRMGVQAGWPDLILLPPQGAAIAAAHFLELKRPGSGLSEPQAAFRLWCRLNKYPHATVYDLKQAIEVLKRWKAVRSGIDVQ